MALMKVDEEQAGPFGQTTRETRGGPRGVTKCYLGEGQWWAGGVVRVCRRGAGVCRSEQAQGGGKCPQGQNRDRDRAELGRPMRLTFGANFKLSLICPLEQSFHQGGLKVGCCGVVLVVQSQTNKGK